MVKKKKLIYRQKSQSSYSLEHGSLLYKLFIEILENTDSQKEKEIKFKSLKSLIPYNYC